MLNEPAANPNTIQEGLDTALIDDIETAAPPFGSVLDAEHILPEDEETAAAFSHSKFLAGVLSLSSNLWALYEIFPMSATKKPSAWEYYGDPDSAQHLKEDLAHYHEVHDFAVIPVGPLSVSSFLSLAASCCRLNQSQSDCEFIKWALINAYIIAIHVYMIELYLDENNPLPDASRTPAIALHALPAIIHAFTCFKDILERICGASTPTQARNLRTPLLDAQLATTRGSSTASNSRAAVELRPPLTPKFDTVVVQIENYGNIDHSRVFNGLDVDSIPEADIKSLYLCPITQGIMLNPVIAVDGHCYEESQIKLWFASHNTSPKTGVCLQDKSVRPCPALRNDIQNFLNEYMAKQKQSLREQGSCSQQIIRKLPRTLTM